MGPVWDVKLFTATTDREVVHGVSTEEDVIASVAVALVGSES